MVPAALGAPLVVPRVVAERILGVCRQPGCIVLCLWFALLASFVFFSLFSFPLPVSLQVRLSPNLPFELPLAVLGRSCGGWSGSWDRKFNPIQFNGGPTISNGKREDKELVP